MLHPSFSCSPWIATHRLIASFGFPKAVHAWRVMLTADGSAYTRHDWMHGLPPSFRALSADAWTYHNSEVQRTTIIKGILRSLTPQGAAWRLDTTPAYPLRHVV